VCVFLVIKNLLFDETHGLDKNFKYLLIVL
jgi:hypothetical protein